MDFPKTILSHASITKTAQVLIKFLWMSFPAFGPAHIPENLKFGKISGFANQCHFDFFSKRQLYCKTSKINKIKFNRNERAIKWGSTSLLTSFCSAFDCQILMPQNFICKNAVQTLKVDIFSGCKRIINHSELLYKSSFVFVKFREQERFLEFITLVLYYTSRRNRKF